MNKQFSTTPIFFFFVFVLVSYLLWLMAKQMIAPIIFGFIIAGVFYPLKNKLQNHPKLNNNWASILTCFIIFLVVLLPLFYLTISISKEAVGLFQSIKEAMSNQAMDDFLFGQGFVAKKITRISEFLDMEFDLNILKAKIFSVLKGVSGSIFTSVNKVAGNIFVFLYDLIIMMIVIYGVFLEGRRLKNYIFELSPLPTEQEEKILQIFNQMNYVTLVCNGLGGVIQGILGGIALWLAGIDSILLWTAVMILLAFIPFVGISFVTVPVSIYLMVTGHVSTGVIILIYSIVVGLVVENWFKPKFIGDRIQINSTFVLLTIIGGMGVFGMAGIFYGPIIGILFLTIVEIYHDQYNSVEVD